MDVLLFSTMRCVSPETIHEKPEREIAQYMTLLQHASACPSTPPCDSANCARMKALLNHCPNSAIKAHGGCNVCRRVWALLQIHAKRCAIDEDCPVPHCKVIRERYRQLRILTTGG